jgi:lipopolysaccharide/colanic/teichoic acid biosynthesis glycosyltransferase
MHDGLPKKSKTIKRWFDLFISCVGFVILLFPIIILTILSTISTRKFGLYSQNRIGLKGKTFTMFKIRSMKSGGEDAGITLKGDPRITGFGRFLRNYKLDEFPQLWNVIIGDMSLVGPRPDLPGYADKLTGDDRMILSVKPAITGPASLKYKDEEIILSEKTNPKNYNDEVIWKDKVEINKEYIKNWSFKVDINYILKTIFS